MPTKSKALTGNRLRCWRRIVLLGVDRATFTRRLRKAGIIAPGFKWRPDSPVLAQMDAGQVAAALKLLAA